MPTYLLWHIIIDQKSDLKNVKAYLLTMKLEIHIFNGLIIHCVCDNEIFIVIVYHGFKRLIDENVFLKELITQSSYTDA